MHFIVYGLFDPRKPLELENVRYIGQTTQPITKRLKQEIYDAKRGIKRHSYNWIRSLLNDGVEPIVRVLVECERGDHLDNAERFWIAYGRFNGWDLTNEADGGEGQTPGFRMTNLQRQQLSEIVIQRHIDDPGIGERKRQGQLARWADPQQRETILAALRCGVKNRDRSPVWCSECNAGPFEGPLSLAGHVKAHGDRTPTMCSECEGGPFVGPHGLTMHRQHVHENHESMYCDCGEGPFDGQHGLGIHQGRYCLLRYPNARQEQSKQLTEIYANNVELRSMIGERVSEALGKEDKTPLMCQCGEGPFVGPRALKGHRSSSLTCGNPTSGNSQIKGQMKRGTPKSSEARSKIAERQRNNRWRCSECGLETNGGALAGHQKRTGHTGKEHISSKDS